jgi:hypothetical protein
MKPRMLMLDHFAPARRSPRAGWVALLAALAVAAALAVWQQALVRELDTLAAESARAGRAPAARRAAAVKLDPRLLDDAARRAQFVTLELRLPWNALFEAIELAAEPAVALLGIEPDVRRSALRITAEARNRQAMLDYVARLGAQPPIARALLESHAERGAGAPVRFTLIAYWESQR